MAKKRKTQQHRTKQPVKRKREPSVWMITTFVAVIFLVGLAVKTLYSSAPKLSPATAIRPVGTQAPESLETNPVEDNVRLVAMNFKCACGGCGELPLAECQCSMPRGAVEEKSFIRTKLVDGLTVPQVIELVDQKYGNKAT